MLNYLIDYLLNFGFNPTISNLLNYISVRSALAIIFSLFITIYYGKHIIKILNKKLVNDEIRDLGLLGQAEKNGTPTMGGIIILISVLIPTVLLCDLTNIYIIIMLITTFWMGLIGFVDDYIKVFKKNKKGLAGRFKILGQTLLGIMVCVLMYNHDDIVIRENLQKNQKYENEIIYNLNNNTQYFGDSQKSLKTTIPFFKNNQLDYETLTGDGQKPLITFLLFAFIVVFIITAVSNSANLTDGIDGLATGCSAIIGATLGIFCYVSGNMVFANYLDIMFIPNLSELVVFMSSFVGACVGFLWYNSYPAQVFMGDVGSLSIGGIIGVVSILIRKELLIPIFCGIFFIESLSVIIQVSYFKYTKRKFGQGVRIFKMSPIHHHFQKNGIHESKIVTRFWIICVFICLLAFVTLKIR
tara:strand:+ start:1984 stop:3222 length:1239 start_codon:yes stop_codon:yes gene_type:complete